MKTNKKIMLAIMLSIIMLTQAISIPTYAQSINVASNNTATNTTGTYTSKEEVIYSTLDSNGKAIGVYVVNILDITKDGSIVDYGNYSEIKNLTNLETIKSDNNTITINAKKGNFYYQGNAKNTDLPWDFSIVYSLDGKEISPKELAGKEGKLEIKIKSTKNKSINSSFYENFMLQISVGFDNNKCKNIITKDGIFANSGKDKLVNFTLMPNSDLNTTITADVTDFEMNGITITGIPFSMSFDLPDTNEMTKGLVTLSEAITQLNNGLAELKGGTKSLNDGINKLKDGSASYKTGINMLNKQSGELTSASKKISDSLNTISSMLNGNQDLSGLESLSQLPTALSQLSSGLGEISTGLNELKNGFNTAYATLNAAIATIPDSIGEADLKALYAANSGNKTFEKLINNYAAAQTVKSTYDALKPAFDSVATTLDTVANKSLYTVTASLNTISEQLTASMGSTDIGKSLAQLSEGIGLIATNYTTFHNGIVAYTNGLSQLSTSYGDLNSGIASVADGSTSLYDGIAKVSEGSNELNNQTMNLPKQIDSTIDDLVGNYDFSNYSPVSFASDKNENVNAVQFIITTQKIEKEKIISEVEEQKTENFWDRLKNLFR